MNPSRICRSGGGGGGGSFPTETENKSKAPSVGQITLIPQCWMFDDAGK